MLCMLFLILVVKCQTNPKKKRSDLWLPERAGRRGKWMKAVKRYKLPAIR